MIAPGFHSTTSMAVKSVVSEVKRLLAKRFNFLPGMPEFFYDFNKGLSEQFKQYYAKINANDRLEPWIALSYSYDTTQKSSVQPRNGLYYYRPITSILKRKIGITFVELPLLFSVLTNNSKLLNGLANYIDHKLDWSFTTTYQDLLWPTHVQNIEYPLGWYVRPSLPNGHIYMVKQSGISGATEPEWSTTGDTVDGSVVWEVKDPAVLTVKAGTFVKNNTTIQNPIENGIMYQLDFGYTLHYADYDDDDELAGAITEATMKLLELYTDVPYEDITFSD